MKIKGILTTIVCLFTALACTKEDVNSNGSKYYMRFKADNVQKEFIYTTAYFFDNNSVCALNGGTNDNTGNGFTIDIYSTAQFPLKAGTTFKVDELVPGPKKGVPLCYFAYAVDNPAEYNYLSWVPDLAERPVYESTVTIDELDEVHVKGKFSGKVREAKGSKLITLTDGEFLVERK